MIRRRLAIVLTAAVVVSLAAAMFLPIFSVSATPANWQYYSTTSMREGNQTVVATSVRNPPTYPALGSLTYCFFGWGGLSENGTWYLFTRSHLSIQGTFCPTPQ